MKMKYVFGALILVCRAAWSQDVLGEYKWQDIKAIPTGATLAQMDGRQVLKIENTNDGPLQLNLLTVEQPKITAQMYELTGEVRYDGVKGDGFLEMWNYFPPDKTDLSEGAYFSRTLGDFGPMGKISGTSGWREFTLPFDRTGASGPPTRLQFNLVLPGRGTVYIGPVKLIQMPKARSASSLIYPNEWWDGRAAGKLFGWGGGLIGCLGALCGWLAAKGKARGLVIGILAALTGLGAVMGLTGLMGLALGQPLFIWAPMLFVALLLLAVCPVHLRQFRRKYEELELRRMTAIDASGA
jgi:hypothetical protein